MHRFTFQNDIQMRAAGGPKPLPSSAAPHRELIEVIASRDSIRAAATMRDHIEAVIAFWSPVLQRAMRDSALSERPHEVV
jgi:DNA-binding FadR family transcriptional regulator